MPVQSTIKTNIIGGLSSSQSSLLWMLAVAAEKGTPLVEEIDALAEDARGGQRKRLRDLADMLRAGIPLPEAVENVPGLFPPQVSFAVRTGSETGRLGPALRAAAEGLSSAYEEEQNANKMFLFYCVFLFLVLLSITNFLMYYIVPKFEAIFRDLGVNLPESTETFFSISRLYVNYFFLATPLMCGAVLLFFFVSLWGMFGGMRFVEIPHFVIRLFPRLESATLLRNLSLAVDSGRPMVDAISLSAYYYPRPTLRGILAQIEVAVRHADDSFAQLQQHRLITRSEELLLRSAERVGNLSWALKNVADTIERRNWYRFRLLAEFFKPLVILAFGLLVMCVTVCMFMPLIRMIDVLS